MSRARRPRLAVWKFASCDGCQLSLLDCEDELLALAGEVEIAHFLEASSATSEGPYDVSLVEGSITTPEDARRILEVRATSRVLVTIGACATAGGVQALRNTRELPQLLPVVYARPEWIDALATSTPIASHVRVDHELRGCPVSKQQLLGLLSSLLAGRRPDLPAEAVCLACKRSGTVCVMVARGTPCLGPVTHTGCDGLCPRWDRGCFGCFGPKEAPNTAALARALRELGLSELDLVRAFRSFNAGAEPFAREAAAHE